MIVKMNKMLLDDVWKVQKKLADEIIIVDTGLRVKTVEIAVSLYPKYCIILKWIDDFAAARNFSFQRLQKEYILWRSCDADDVIE